MKAAIRAVLIVILLLALAGGGGAWYIWNGMQPVEPAGPAVTFTIEKGMGSSEIADLLEENGIIRNGLLFKGYLKWVKEGSSFKAGTYTASPGDTYDQLIARLNAGDVVKEETVVFTIPEGFTAKQVADKLAEAWNQKAEVFLKVIDSGTGLAAADRLGIPVNAELRHRLEGYLFPETYELVKDSTPQEIVEAMLEQLEKKLDSIPDWKTKLDKRGLSLHELLTVASLVEREVVVDEERPLVAGVIYNRLNKGQKLEIDATVQYLLDKQKERLLNKDLKVDSPYNTYKNAGLPPGPIASPGLASIQAALEPKASEYYFYVTKKDGSQGHLFGKTYKEHLANIQKSEQSSP
ncbi:Endolytic murein transglycosylase [Paenibacillus auburnensis]|uniref:Endolytic murein transglycosylase n=1 Tax=Paenibacillus auburnensis TaxID=2905649 RepID=A0ABN8GHA5_9BACL|nr:endolytic transglycosylase MltG [Paenibacillus auburnensis]CAH1205816.1 Endolytic murein transglycosylase [Paenibacillus auburnensis]